MTDLRLLPRTLGQSGLKVTPLALASYARSAVVPGDVERAYHEYGMNTFLAHSRFEKLCEGVRRLIRAGHRDALTLVSAFGAPFAGSARRGLEKHLRLLGTDHIDVWLIAWLQSRWYARESVWCEMERLRAAGRARAIGFSSHNRALAADLAASLPADVIMVRYNAAHRGAERDVFDRLRPLGDRRPGIIAYTATRWGMLLKPQPRHGFPEAITAGECYRFVLDHPMVDAVWCAAATPEELRDDVAAVLAGPLTGERRGEICRFGDAVHAAQGTGGRWTFGGTAE